MSAANATAPASSAATTTALDDARRAHEPSMEEILASIRRIIADDDGGAERRRDRFALERRRLDGGARGDGEPQRPTPAEILRRALSVETPPVANAPEAVPVSPAAESLDFAQGFEEPDQPQVAQPEEYDAHYAAEAGLNAPEAEAAQYYAEASYAAENYAGEYYAGENHAEAAFAPEAQAELIAQHADMVEHLGEHLADHRDERLDEHPAADLYAARLAAEAPSEDHELAMRLFAEEEPADTALIEPARFAQERHAVEAAAEPDEPVPAADDSAEAAPLVSANAAAAIASHFQTLATTMLVNDSGILQQQARDMLRPMLKQWLDDNLPVMVERLVRAEIERVARGGRG
jgi:uncharacterized protein